MQRIPARSADAQTAYELVTALQGQLVSALETLARHQGKRQAFRAVEWFRDEGRHGGGVRYEAGDAADTDATEHDDCFNRASVNISQVQYDDDPARSLASATALSSIVHPQHPFAPSLHLHISWTELKTGTGYWRIMADLNPAIAEHDLRERYEAALREAAPEQFDAASAQGDRYFYIPALQRHRGISHFYLEAFNTGDPSADLALARRVGEAVIAVYPALVADRMQAHPAPAPEDQARQLAYHSLYFFQVLTLDRGTTSGLLVHDQNDIGILGSLPARIDRALLASWQALLPAPQDQLLAELLSALPDQNPCPVDEAAKARLAAAVRAHYQRHPQALALQASGDVVPPTVANHQGKMN